MMVSQLRLYREELEGRERTGQRSDEKAVFIKNNRESLVKVSKSQLIKVRRHILTSAAGFMERLQGFHGHPEISYSLYMYVCICIFLSGRRNSTFKDGKL